MTHMPKSLLCPRFPGPSTLLTDVFHSERQPDVRELGDTAHENDIRRFDVAVNEPGAVQVGQSHIERQPQGEAFVDRQSSAR